MIRVAFVTGLSADCHMTGGNGMATHCACLSAMADVKVVGHCNEDAKHAKAAAERFGGDAYTDFVTMYDKVKPHAVYVSVPPFAHGGIEEEAANRGIHLFLEKPIALDRKTARAIAAAVRRTKVLTSVGYRHRYHDTVVRARQLLKGKAISLVSGCWRGEMPQVWWWRRKDKSGGQIVEQTTLLFDLLRYLCGEVTEVHAVASSGCMTKVTDYDIDDSSVVSLRLKNGASACITSTCVMSRGTTANDRVPGGRCDIEIVTPETTLHLDVRPSMRSPYGGVLRYNESGKTTRYYSGTDVFEEENRAFIDAIRGAKRSRIKSTYADALKTFLVTNAANESIRSGMPAKP